MVFMGTVSLIGGATSLVWAPETNNLRLTQTGHRDAGARGWWAKEPLPQHH